MTAKLLQENDPYIAQKESRFPEGRISSRRNDVNKGRAARFLAYS